MRPTRTNVWLGILVVVVASLAACGGSGDKTSTTNTTTTRHVSARLRGAVPPAAANSEPAVQLRGAPTASMDQFLTYVVNNVDAYWASTFKANNVGFEPFVNYNWMPSGQSFTTACPDKNGDASTNDTTLEYCSNDDTIYVSQKAAVDLWNGLYNGPDSKTGPDRGAADFGVAYVVAHEYGHEIQSEKGVRATGGVVINLELQADCYAGAWANSVWRQGLLEDNDVDEAIRTVNFVGDYDYLAPDQHHGTPEERKAAWELGYNSGDPAQCEAQYIP